MTRTAETDDRITFDVELTGSGSSTRHVVTASRADVDAQDGPPEEFVRHCFVFLLEREPKESIWAGSTCETSGGTSRSSTATCSVRRADREHRRVPMRTDALVVGGGLAGLYAVLHLPPEWDVVVVDKGTETRAGSSPLAQGGMAVPIGPDDSPSLHAEDTVRVGSGACDAGAVRVLTEEAGAALEELVSLGCEFDRAGDGSFDLNREGGQSVARSVHRADATGRELMRVV